MQNNNHSRTSSRVWATLLVLPSLILITGCPWGTTVTVPKAACKTTDIIVDNVGLTVAKNDIYAEFTFDFCLKCPGEPPTPIANVPVTITVPGVNVSFPASLTTDTNGCVRAQTRKAITDVGTPTALNGKPVTITVEGTDGKKALPGPFSIKAN
jgi:hypothetical protein